MSWNLDLLEPYVVINIESDCILYKSIVHGSLKVKYCT